MDTLNGAFSIFDSQSVAQFLAHLTPGRLTCFNDIDPGIWVCLKLGLPQIHFACQHFPKNIQEQHLRYIWLSLRFLRKPRCFCKDFWQESAMFLVPTSTETKVNW